MRRQVIGVSVLFGALSFLQGIGEPTTGLVTQPTQSLLKEWGSEAGDIATFVALLGGPWCLKPLYGLLCDFVPLAGYRRKSYLVAAAVATTVCFLALYLLPLGVGTRQVLFIALFLPALAITISDVVLDAMVIEAGQSLAITGRLQSIAAGAGYAATLLTGVWGGRLTESHEQRLGYLLCGGLMAMTLLLSIVYVREPRERTTRADFAAARRTVGDMLRSPAVLAVAAFMFAWHFTPFSQSVLYLHMTETLEFTETSYGATVSWTACGSIVGCVVYGFYCRRVSMRRLVPAAIACGAASTLVYWPLSLGPASLAVSLLAGFTYMTGLMIQFDLAARACPSAATGTVFALFMATANLATVLSTWLGGRWYDLGSQHWDAGTAFNLLLAVSAVLTGCSWFAARRLPRELLA